LCSREWKEISLPNARVILCVDDEPVGLTARRLLLSIAGYTVLTAATGKTALGLFGCNQIDLVITDHLLPDVNGAEMIAEMKRSKPEVPIVLLTGLVDLPPGAEHADLLLTKGITPSEFLSEIAKLVPQERSLKAKQA
jgi:CheY-like chemotaxis protein